MQRNLVLDQAYGVLASGVVQLLLNLRVHSPLVATTGIFCHQGEQCSSSVPVLVEGACAASVSDTLPAGEGVVLTICSSQSCSYGF